MYRKKAVLKIKLFQYDSEGEQLSCELDGSENSSEGRQQLNVFLHSKE